MPGWRKNNCKNSRSSNMHDLGVRNKSTLLLGMHDDNAHAEVLTFTFIFNIPSWESKILLIKLH